MPAQPKITYRLRDWLFSRQRYWGEPIPVLHLADGSVVPLPEDSLPLLPPELDDYKPAPGGEPPLARADGMGADDAYPAPTSRPCARPTRCRNGPVSAGTICASSIRTTTRHSSSPEAENYWMPVDIYVGGAEHAVLHLLYARFWHKVLYDIGAGVDQGAVPQAVQPGHDPGLLLPRRRRALLRT